MPKSYAEIDVVIRAVTQSAMLAFDGDVEGWVAFSLLDEDGSELGRKSNVGDTGTIVLPQWKAEAIGFV